MKSIVSKSRIESLLSSLRRRNERLMQVAVKEWMNFAQRQIRTDLVRKYSKSFASELTDWEVIENNGVKTIKPTALEIMRTGGNAAYKHLAIAGSFDVVNVSAVNAVNRLCSKLVREVTNNTKKGINTYVKHGIKQGWSMGKIARQIRPLVGLTGTQAQSVINFRNILAEKHPGYSAAQLDKATMRYTDKTHRLRLENIARTETARAQNIGYCQGLGEVGVKEVELSNADDPCEICEGLNGTRYKIDEASGIIPVHPRCRCAMLPVINGKPIDKPLAAPPANLWQTVPDYTETVSNEFKSLVTKQVGAYPKKVTRVLTEKNIKFRAGKRLTELHPELKGKHPRGWSRGSTWDSAEGAFHIKSNSISVAETYRPIRQKFYVKVPEKRVIGVLNHETGHAFNTVGMYSETNEFKLAYKKDVSNLTQLDIAENNLRYFLQSGSVGRDETFAESFAVLSGQGSNVWGDDITKFFPNSAKYVKDLLK